MADVENDVKLVYIVESFIVFACSEDHPNHCRAAFYVKHVDEGSAGRRHWSDMRQESMAKPTAATSVLSVAVPSLTLLYWQNTSEHTRDTLVQIVPRCSGMVSAASPCCLKVLFSSS